MELYEKDGKIGILVSPGLGLGWSTHYGDPKLAYDKRIVEFWLAHKDDETFMRTINHFDTGTRPESKAYKEAVDFFASIGYENIKYMAGFGDIEIVFVERGTPWRITEYDGDEEFETFETAGFITF